MTDFKRNTESLIMKTLKIDTFELDTFEALNPKSINVSRSFAILLGVLCAERRILLKYLKNLARRFENNFIGPSK